MHTDQAENNRISFGFAVLIWAIVLASLTGCGRCKYLNQTEDYSPSGERVVANTVINCAAFGHYITQVNIRRATAAFNDKEGLVVSLEDRQTVVTVWKDDRNLIVYLPKAAVKQDFANRSIIHQLANVDGVEIEYRTL